MYPGGGFGGASGGFGGGFGGASGGFGRAGGGFGNANTRAAAALFGSGAPTHSSFGRPYSVTPSAAAYASGSYDAAIAAAIDEMDAEIRSVFAGIQGGGAHGYKQRGGASLADIKRIIAQSASAIVAVAKSGASLVGRAGSAVVGRAGGAAAAAAPPIGRALGRAGGGVAAAARGAGRRIAASQTAEVIGERVADVAQRVAATPGAVDAGAAGFLRTANWGTLLKAIAAISTVAAMYGVGPPYDTIIQNTLLAILSVLPAPSTILASITSSGISWDTVTSAAQLAGTAAAAAISYFSLKVASRILMGAGRATLRLGRAAGRRAASTYAGAEAYVSSRLNTIVARLEAAIAGGDARPLNAAAAAVVAEADAIEGGGPIPAPGEAGFIGPLREADALRIQGLAEGAQPGLAQEVAGELVAVINDEDAADALLGLGGAAAPAGGGPPAGGEGGGMNMAEGGYRKSRRGYKKSRHVHKSRRHRRSARRKSTRSARRQH